MFGSNLPRAAQENHHVPSWGEGKEVFVKAGIGIDGMEGEEEGTKNDSQIFILNC